MLSSGQTKGLYLYPFPTTGKPGRRYVRITVVTKLGHKIGDKGSRLNIQMRDRCDPYTDFPADVASGNRRRETLFCHSGKFDLLPKTQHQTSLLASHHETGVKNHTSLQKLERFRTVTV